MCPKYDIRIVSKQYRNCTAGKTSIIDNSNNLKNKHI